MPFPCPVTAAPDFGTSRSFLAPERGPDRATEAGQPRNRNRPDRQKAGRARPVPQQWIPALRSNSGGEEIKGILEMSFSFLDHKILCSSTLRASGRAEGETHETLLPSGDEPGRLSHCLPFPRSFCGGGMST